MKNNNISFFGYIIYFVRNIIFIISIVSILFSVILFWIIVIVLIFNLEIQIYDISGYMLIIIPFGVFIVGGILFILSTLFHYNFLKINNVDI